MSHSLPVSDAGLGSLAYTIEFLMGYMGATSRWRTMPWMVTIFGILVIPLGVGAHLSGDLATAGGTRVVHALYPGRRHHAADDSPGSGRGNRHGTAHGPIQTARRIALKRVLERRQRRGKHGR